MNKYANSGVITLIIVAGSMFTFVYNHFYGRQLLFPEPHKEQDGRSRSARHGSLGNKKGNQENLQAD